MQPQPDAQNDADKALVVPKPPHNSEPVPLDEADDKANASKKAVPKPPSEAVPHAPPEAHASGENKAERQPPMLEKKKRKPE